MGYEQLILLRTLHRNPDIEGFELCKKSDCSFDEFQSLASGGYIDAGIERLKPAALHPVIAEKGITTYEQAEKDGVLKRSENVRK